MMTADIIYHSMTKAWENKMAEQGFHYPDSTIVEMTFYFEIENLNFFMAFVWANSTRPEVTKIPKNKNETRVTKRSTSIYLENKDD